MPTIRKGADRKAHEWKNRSRETGNDLMRQVRNHSSLGVDSLGDLTTPHNATCLDHQMGNPMTYQEIKALIGRLNPNLIVSSLPEPGKAAVFGPDGKGGMRLLCPFDAPIAPEWSVLSVRYEDMPVGDIPETVTDIEQLAMEPVATMGSEIIRGWRTLFARLIMNGWISLEAFERLMPYKGPVRFSWASSLRKIKETPRL